MSTTYNVLTKAQSQACLKRQKRVTDNALSEMSNEQMMPV